MVTLDGKFIKRPSRRFPLRLCRDGEIDTDHFGDIGKRKKEYTHHRPKIHRHTMGEGNYEICTFPKRVYI